MKNKKECALRILALLLALFLFAKISSLFIEREVRSRIKPTISSSVQLAAMRYFVESEVTAQDTKNELVAVVETPVAPKVILNNPKPEKKRIRTIGKVHVNKQGQARLIVRLYEQDLPFVKVGDTVSLDLPSCFDNPIDARVDFIDSTKDPRTKTTKVVFLLENSSHKLQDGSFVVVRIKTQNSD